MRKYLASLLVTIAGIAGTGEALQVATEISLSLGMSDPDVSPISPQELSSASSPSKLKKLLRKSHIESPAKAKRSVRHQLEMLKRDGALLPKLPAASEVAEKVLAASDDPESEYMSGTDSSDEESGRMKQKVEIRD